MLGAAVSNRPRLTPAPNSGASDPSPRSLGFFTRPGVVRCGGLGYHGVMNRRTIHPYWHHVAGTVLLAGACLMPGATSIGCSTQRSADRRDAAAEDIPILWQAGGTYSRIGRPVRILARDPATLAQIPLTDVPVSFDTQMVLIAGLGPTPNSEQGIRIVRVWREGSKTRVQERLLDPGGERSTGLEPASPWTVAVIPRSDLNVEGYSTRVPGRLLRDHPGSR